MLKPLPRTNDLREFREEYFAKHAVVVTGALAGMPASRWTPGYLAEALADHKPTVRLGNGRLAHMRMKDFFRYFEMSDAVTSSSGSVYLRDFYLNPSFGDAARAAVGADIRCPLVEEEAWPAWRERHRGWKTLYCGPAGSTSSLHVDMYSTHTWLAEISGRKAWRLAAPGALTEEVAFRTDPFADAELPCTFFDTVLEPGDVIYLPPDWWHAVVNLTATIAVSGNFCSVEHAEACLAEVRAEPESSMKKVWLDTWTAIVEEGASAPI